MRVCNNPPMSVDHVSAVRTTPAGYFKESDCHLADLVELAQIQTDITEYPHAIDVISNVLIYDAPALASTLADPTASRILEAEVAQALMSGPGIVVFKQAFADTEVIDRASRVFFDIIEAEKADGTAKGDHFGKPGANNRIWNALEKLAVIDPDTFVDYYSNDIIAFISRAWLGPNYQITSQINVVNPGGAAQTVHRDYHLGFQSNSLAEQFPAHVHYLSPVLTLQGAVAHVDMPVESGPTLYLPHTQKYGPGYLAWRIPEFREYFEANYIQLPLEKGDMVYFNPALFHAAGNNISSDIRRMANLLQVSSAFGRAMETIDRERVAGAIFGSLRKAKEVGGFSERQIANAIASSAEGYSFPTNLDRDQPIGGLAPLTQAEIVAQAIAEDWDEDKLVKAIAEQAQRKRSS